MKIKILVIILLVASLFSISYIGAMQAPEKLAWAEMPPNTNPNLKYFGYYHVTGCLDEVKEFGANFSKIDADEIEEIQNLYNKGYMIFIMTRYIFYSNGELHPDYAQRWENTKTELAPYMDKIIGFYVDEPYFTGKTKEAFHMNCQLVRQDFPDKKMMAVLSLQGLNNADLDYFDYCTDLGYDLYWGWDKDGVLDYIALLKEKYAKNDQYIWLVPKGFYTIKKDIYALVESRKLLPGDDIIRWIKGSYEIAVADHRITGIFSFVYDNDNYDMSLRKFMINDNDGYREDLRDIYVQIAKAVSNNY